MSLYIIYSDTFRFLNVIFFILIYIETEDVFQEPKHVAVNYLNGS